MGNNKGRSKGCRTCLERRVKCDETRPICKRCVRSKFTCRGYRDLKFIDVGLQFESRLRNQYHVHAKSTLSLEISLSAWQDDIVLSYLVGNLGQMRSICQRLHLGSQPPSPPLAATRQCFLALALTLFGIGHADLSMVNEGRCCYIRALKTVNEALNESKRPKMKELLGSVIALTLHEAVSPTATSKQIWLQHVQGLQQLFVAHGPITDASDPVVKDLLDATRTIIITASLYTRQPSILTQSRWHLAVHGCANSYLLDAMAQLPVLYQRLDRILLSPNLEVSGANENHFYDTHGLQSLLEDSINFLSSVRAYGAQWHTAQACSEVSSLPSTSTDLATTPSPDLERTLFSSIQAANIFSLHQCLIIIINRLIISIIRLLPMDEVCANHGAVAEQDTLDAAQDIVMSADYHVQSILSNSAATFNDFNSRNFYLVLPMRIAYQTLVQYDSPTIIYQTLRLRKMFNILMQHTGPWASNNQIFKIE